MPQHRCTRLVRLALIETLVAAAGAIVLVLLVYAVESDALSAAAGFARF